MPDRPRACAPPRRRPTPPCGHEPPGRPCPPARLYPCGWRCDAHSPAALAGRAVPVPDPALTLDALRAAHRAAAHHAREHPVTGPHATHVVRLGAEGAPALATCDCGWCEDAPGAAGAARACWAHLAAQPPPPAVAGHPARGRDHHEEAGR